MTEYRFTSIRWINGKQKKVIVDICGDIINRNPTKEGLKDIIPELPRLDLCNDKEYLLEFLRCFYKKEGRSPKVKDFDGNPKYPHYSAYQTIFGNWNNSLDLAGLLDKRDFSRYIDEELLESLMRFKREEGRPPTETDLINNPEYPGFSTYQRRFGSLQKALKLVGIDIDSMVRKGILKTSHQKARLAEIFVLEHFSEKATDLSGENFNSFADGICPKNQIYDVKSSALLVNYWIFHPYNDRRDKMEWFYLLGFNEDYSELKYVWRIPGDFIEEDSIAIGINNNYGYNIENMREYEITEKFKSVFDNWLDNIIKKDNKEKDYEP